MNSTKITARILEDVQIKLAILWVSLILTYLFGDKLRIFRSHFIVGEIGGKKITQEMWMGVAILMVIPIIMIFLFLTQACIESQGEFMSRPEVPSMRDTTNHSIVAKKVLII